MARRGRPRKDATALMPPIRENGGRVQRLTTVEQIALAEKARAQREMSVVLAQPHRQGNNSQLSESVLGRFCQQHRLRRELYDAGIEYGAMKRRWVRYWDAPLPDSVPGAALYKLPDDEDAERWRKWIEKAEAAIVREHGDLRAIQAMCVHERTPSAWTGRAYVINGLLALAIEIGRLDAKATPR